MSFNNPLLLVLFIEPRQSTTNILRTSLTEAIMQIAGRIQRSFDCQRATMISVSVLEEKGQAFPTTPECSSGTKSASKILRGKDKSTAEHQSEL